jgi:putative ABC transport system permease protein
MLKNYFKIILRSLWRNKLYTVINVLGLSFGIAALVWGVQTYRYSFSFDDFHKHQNEIYRVLTKAEGADRLKGICPSSLAQFAKQDFSAVQQAVRWDSRGLDIKAEQSEPFATSAHFTDPAFFEFFNFEFVKGKADLKNQSTVVITESAVKKYFGNTDPIGKTLLFYSAETYKKYLTVTGVLKTPPYNSTINFEVITHFDNQLAADGSIMKHDEWNWFTDAVFLKIKNPADASQLEKSFAKYIPLQQEARKDIKVSGFKLESMAKHALMANRLDNNALIERPEDSAAYGTLILALLILLSACLNFANTSVAQSNRKLKEIGIRKVVGSSHRQIIIQQLMECAFIVFIAIGLSILLNFFWLPTFNSMFSFIKVSADYLSDYTLLIILGVILITVTLLAGGYPAFYISRFNATSIFRGSVKFGGSNLFSRVLLGFQIVISFITVIAGLAFSRNTTFQKNYDFGYDRNTLIGFFVQSGNDYNVLRNEINNIKGIETITGSTQHIGFWHRTASLEAKGEKKESNYLEVGDNYINTVQLKLLAGRSFYVNSEADIEKAMLINEKLAFKFGWKIEEAVGKQIKLDTLQFTVVGVLKDFNTGNLFDPLEPFAISVGKPEKYVQLIIRTKPGEATNVHDQVKAAWTKVFPLKPFRGYYQNETAGNSLQTTASIAKIFFWFAIISILMSATGMFALVSLTVLKKTREIAIRKVVGADAMHIYKLVLKGYVLIFLIAAILGCYAGYSLSKLLMDLIFRINAGVAVTTLWVSFLCMLLITAVTVGSRVWAALQRKSAEVLKGD